MYFMLTGRLVFAYVFIVSAWREFHGIYLNGGLAADEFSLYQFIYRLGIVMRIFGGILFIFNTYLGALLLLIYQAILCPILFDLFNRSIVQFQQSVQHFLQIAPICGVQRKLLFDEMSKYVNETISLYDEEEEGRQKLCNTINEIERMVISNPLFAPSELNSFRWSQFNIFKFIKGFGIVAVLVFFIAMKHRSSSVKRKSN